MSTICAISTARGGAIGIVRVSGSDAISIADRIFKGKKTLADTPSHRLAFGTIIAPSPAPETVSMREKLSVPEAAFASQKVSVPEASSVPETEVSGKTVPIDEVLVSVFRAPHSYTGEDSVEISCHGSDYILQRVCQLLCLNGAEMAKPGEFTQRAFLNGKMDLSQAEAVADIIASRSAASHRIAMQQMRGGISTLLSQLTSQLLELTSLLELELDFSEEDVEFADRTRLLSIAKDIESELQRLINSFATGNAIKNGIPVAIIGAPNVGKSTLLNQLLQEDKAIVSDIQGTTRDLIEDTITINGALFRFIDTAGIRHTDDTIEQLGIERSIKAAEKAHIIILITEPGVDFPDIPIREDQHVIRIINKTDNFQALHGIGVDSLLSQLSSFVPATSDEDVIISNLRHQQALTFAKDSISRSITAMLDGIPSDLVAEDLRQCISHLEEITGRQIDIESVLGNIFSKFCIGK